MHPNPPAHYPAPFAWRWFNRLSLRGKTLCIGGGLMLFILLLGAGIQRVGQQGFNRIEDQYFQDHAVRVDQVFAQAAGDMERYVHDYAVWDDSYAFISQPTAKYLEDNLGYATLTNLRVNHALIFNGELKLVAGRSPDPVKGEIRNTDPAVVRAVTPMVAELLQGAPISSAGMLRVGKTLYLLGLCKIHPTNKGLPANGAFVHMREIDSNLIHEFSRVLRVDLSLSTDPASLERIEAQGRTNPAAFLVLAKTEERVQMGVPIHDYRERVVGLVETTLTRDIHQQAGRFALFVWVTFLAVLLATALLWPLIMRWFVLTRLERIHAFIARLQTRWILTDRLAAHPGDELDALAIGFDRALDALENEQRLRDESEKQTLQLQEQLTQVQKIEAIATMAGGIAHDFNNSLGSILGSVELIREEIAPDHPITKHLTRIQKAGSGASALAKQMLNLSRTNPLQRTPIHLAEVLADVLRLVRAGLPKTIEIKFVNTARDDVVLADGTQLQQVVMNLATNASHAMANQPAGIIQVTLTETVLPNAENRPETLPLPAGAYLRLDFSDNGHGVPSEIAAKIFDPFFTTKPVGSGTGLGLAVAQGFAARHGGSLGLESEVDQGATFIMHLPKHQSAPWATPSPVGNGLKVLLVDDDSHGRETLAVGLRRRGHAVTEASNGSYALKLVEESPAGFDVIVTDQIMPGMTGMDLAEQVRGFAPHIPVFLISGYTGPVDDASLQEKGILQLFMKPINVSELDTVLRAAKRGPAES